MQCVDCTFKSTKKLNHDILGSLNESTWIGVYHKLRTAADCWLLLEIAHDLHCAAPADQPVSLYGHDNFTDLLIGLHKAMRLDDFF